MERNPPLSESRHTNVPGISPSMMRVNNVGMAVRLARGWSARSVDGFRDLDHGGSRVVGKTVEHTRREEACASRVRIVGGGVLDEDVHLLRVVVAAEHAVAGRGLARAGTVEGE